MNGMRLDIDAKAMAQEIFERMAGHLDNDMGRQPENCLAQQILQVASGVLYFVESAFDALAHAV